MQVKNGFYAARKTDDGVKRVFIDEELLEMHRQNARVAQRRWDAEYARAQEQKQQILAQRQAQAKERKRRNMVRKLVRQELKLLGAGMVLAAGQALGLVAPLFCVPVLVGILAVICFRAGQFFGRSAG